MSSVVIGGGIAGLLEAMRLAQLGQNVTVIERQDKLGGNISSSDLAGITIDTGAESFSVIDDSMLKLLDQLGLSDLIEYPTEHSALIKSPDSTYEIPVGFFGVPADLNNTELGSIISPLAIEQAKQKDSEPFLDYQSVEELTVARLGEEFFQKLVEPVVSGVHGQSAKTIPAEKIFGSVMEKAKELDSLTAAVGFLRPKNSRPGSAVGSIRGGMSVVVGCLEKALAELGVEFIKSSPVGSLSLGSSWEIETNTGVFNADYLVIASGQVFNQETSSLVDVDRNQTSLVSVMVQSDELNEFPLGPGALLAQNRDGPKATTHLNSKWPWMRSVLDSSTHALRLSFAGVVDIDRDSVGELIEQTYGVKDVWVLDSRVDTWSSPQAVSNKPENSPALGYVGSLVSGNGLTAIAKSHLERSAK